jgi:hypothetical protein
MIARLPDDVEFLKGTSYEPPKSYSDIHNYDTIDYDENNSEMYDDFLAYY